MSASISRDCGVSVKIAMVLVCIILTANAYSAPYLAPYSAPYSNVHAAPSSLQGKDTKTSDIDAAPSNTASSNTASSNTASSNTAPSNTSSSNAAASTQAFALTPAQIRETIKKALSSFYTPSMSVAIVHKGQVVFSGAEGLRNIEQDQAANADTYYRLASTSKAFTAAAIAILVDQRKLKWDDRVIDHLPEFQMQDPWVTREFTIRDLLTHRSGLVSAAGDSMIWPEPSGFSRTEVVHNLRFLTPEYSFRSTYAYSNVMYITAGEIVAKVSQQSFDSFVDKYIFEALDMDCYAGDLPVAALQNAAMSYGHNDKQGQYAITRNAIFTQGLMSAAAGGMVCNANSMAKWMQALLDPSQLPFSSQQLAQMWSPQTILNVSNLDEEWDGTLFKTYGLGWRLSNLFEHKVISHTGTLSGYQAYLSIIPDFELGVMILNNGSNSGARGSVMQSIIKAVLVEAKGLDAAQDWIQEYLDYHAKREAEYLARPSTTPKGTGKMSVTKKQIVGTYTDNWYGDFTIKFAPNSTRKLRIQHSKMQTLNGDVLPHQGLSYKVQWDDTNAQREAFLHFELNNQGDIASLRLHPFTTSSPTNHEYRDTLFIRQQ